jgi:ADP-ribosylglycohydrolase
MDAYRQRYGIITNLYAGSGSTDDTEFALLTARALLDCRGDLTSEAVVQAWHRYIIDEGGVFERGGRPQYGAVYNLQRGVLPPLSGRDNASNEDDGAAMRVAPIGIICAGDPERAAQMAAIDAQISHHADGVWAAQAVAAAMAVAMTGADAATVVEAGLRQIPQDSWLGRAMARALAIAAQPGGMEAAWEPLHTELWTASHSSAAEAVPQAFALFQLTEGDFQRGLFWAANFGRDADTIGALVGALAGARQGFAIIPPAWVEKVRRPSGVCLRFTAKEDVVDIAEQLVALIR